MSVLFVKSVGMFTPVGHSVEIAAGAIFSGASRFVELPTVAWNGEPLVGATTHLTSSGERRLLELASFALAECGQGTPRPLPVMLCCPRSDEVHVDPSRFFPALAELSSIPIDISKSRMFASGSAAVTAALTAAEALLKRREADACYIGGVDSLVDPARLVRASVDDRVREPGHPDGFNPGEAAAFVKVAARADAEDMARIVASAAAEEPNVLGSGTSSGDGTVQALTECLRRADATSDAVKTLVHGGSGERYFAREFATVMSRAPLGRTERTMVGGISLGETGAAFGVLAMGYLAFLFDRKAPGVSRTGALVLASSSGSARAAVLMEGAS